MILNISRAKFFQSCRQYSWNWDGLGLASHRDADALVVGGAYHIGSEVVTATGDVDLAVKEAESSFRKRLEGQLILPEEQKEIENQIEFVRHAVREFARHYDKAEYKVLWPEVSGCVPIPNTEHHCWYAHKLLTDEPYSYHTKCLAAGRACARMQHYLRFKTDGIIELYNKVWLLEQKTTSKADNNFWQKFQLDFQTWGYVYGIWKVTNLKPSGFLVNAIVKHLKKPYGAGKSGYKMELDPTNVDFMREPFLLDEEDLKDWEHDFIGVANEYERAFADKAQNKDSFLIYKNTQNCFSYNRRCYYFDLCKRHQEQTPGEFVERKQDYVDEAYYDLLKIPNPNKKEEPCPMTESTSVTSADLSSTKVS